MRFSSVMRFGAGALLAATLLAPSVSFAASIGDLNNSRPSNEANLRVANDGNGGVQFSLSLPGIKWSAIQEKSTTEIEGVAMDPTHRRYVYISTRTPLGTVNPTTPTPPAYHVKIFRYDLDTEKLSVAYQVKQPSNSHYGFGYFLFGFDNNKLIMMPNDTGPFTDNSPGPGWPEEALTNVNPQVEPLFYLDTQHLSKGPQPYHPSKKFIQMRKMALNASLGQ